MTNLSTETSQQLQTKDFLTHSIKHLDNILSLFNTNGKVITGKDVITMDMIIEEQSMCVKVLAKENEVGRLSALYVIALKELWSNSENTFTYDSITSCALLLINTYHEWYPKEIILMLRNGMACKYGKPFGKLNTIEVMRWAKEYDETDRVEYFEAKVKKPKADWRDIDPDLLKGIGKPEKKLEPKVEREKTEGEKLIQQWMKDFDTLSKEQGYFKGSISFVDIDGEKMDIEKYLNYKLNTIQA